MNPKIKTLYKYVALQLPLLLMVALIPIKAFAANNCANGVAKDCLKGTKTSQIMNLLNIGINILTGFVAVGAVIMLIIAGIQYTASNGNPKAVADAKQRMYNVFIGLVAFAFMWAFLMWLIPGGIFG